jgi:hypothetical protein
MRSTARTGVVRRLRGARREQRRARARWERIASLLDSSGVRVRGALLVDGGGGSSLRDAALADGVLWAAMGDVPADAHRCIVLVLGVGLVPALLDALAALPWSSLVFEGAPGQSMATLDADLAPLRERALFRIAGGLDHHDGMGELRPLAVLVREAL